MGFRATWVKTTTTKKISSCSRPCFIYLFQTCVAKKNLACCKAIMENDNKDVSSNRRSPVMETSAIVEFVQRTLSGAALKFRSWKNSLQVRIETSSGIRHFSYRACLQAEPSISKSLIHLIPTHLFMPYDDLLHDEDRYSRSDVTTEQISSEPSQNLTKPLIKWIMP